MQAHEQMVGLVLDNLCQIAGVEKPKISHSHLSGAPRAILTVGWLQIEIWSDLCYIRIGPPREDDEIFDSVHTFPISEQKAAEILAIWVRQDQGVK